MKESVRYLAAEQSTLNIHFIIEELVYLPKKVIESLLLTNKGKTDKYIISIHFPTSALILYNADNSFSL